MDSSPEKNKNGGQADQKDWSTLENIDMREEKNVAEVIDHFSNNPEEVGVLSQELVAARKEADKEGATWDQDKHTYVDKNGLPMDWAHLTGHLKNNPEAVKTAVESYQNIKEIDYYTENPSELAKELVAARTDDDKNGATWDAEKRTYIDKNGLPLDWAHLTGKLKNDPEAVKTAIDTLRGLKSDNNGDQGGDQGKQDDQGKPESAVRKDYNMRLKWGRYARHIIELNPRGENEKLEDYNKRIRGLIPTINEFRNNDKLVNGPDYPDVGPNQPQESRVHSFAAPRSDIAPDKANTPNRENEEEKKHHTELLRDLRSLDAIKHYDALGIKIGDIKNMSTAELEKVKQQIDAKIAEENKGNTADDNKDTGKNDETLSGDEIRKLLRSLDYARHLDEAGVKISELNDMADDKLTEAYDKIKAIVDGEKDDSAAAEKDKSFDIFNLHKKIGSKITAIADLSRKNPEPNTGADRLTTISTELKTLQQRYDNAPKYNFFLRNRLQKAIDAHKTEIERLQNQQSAAA